jgi:DNA-binding transcriptional LysR family regulator
MDEIFGHLLIFSKVVEVLSFSKAALKLGTTQATVSRKVKHLEAALGVALIKRNTRNLEITAAGAKLYQNFYHQERYLNTLIEGLKDDSKRHEGVLRVSLPHVLSQTHFSPHIAQFLQENSGVALEISYQNREIDLVKEVFDLAIVDYLPKQQTTRIKKIYQMPIYLYCAPSYIKRYGAPQGVDDLSSHLVSGVINSDGSITKVVYACNHGSQETISIENNSRLKLNSMMQTMAIAKSGHAIVGGNDILFAQEIKKGSLVKVLPDYTFGDLNFYLISLVPQKNALMEIFINFISSCLDSGGYNK